MALNNSNSKIKLPTWFINNLSMGCFMVVVAAGMIVLDSRHVTATEVQASQTTVLEAIQKISQKMDGNLGSLYVDNVKERIRQVNSKLEEMKLYIDEVPNGALINAWRQNVRRLENAKEEHQAELQILLSRKPYHID